MATQTQARATYGLYGTTHENFGAAYMTGQNALDIVSPELLTRNIQNSQQSAAFLSQKNALWLQSELEKALTKAVGQPVKVPLDNQFVSHMQQVANNSLRPMPGAEGLALMNNAFLSRYFEIQYFSIRQGKLYDKFFISQDRMRTMPYGQYTPRRGIIISPSQYMMSNPWKKNQAGFLQAAIGLKPKGNSFSNENNTQQLFATPNGQEYCRVYS